MSSQPRTHPIFKIMAGPATWFRNRFAKPPDLKELFRFFKEVLASNNRALELITDMGEKLDGSYIFDIHYIKTTYADLARNLRASLENFNLLTRNRYAIAAVFARLDSIIAEMIHGGAPGGGDRILFLEDIQWFRAREVGGKNYHLAELKNTLGLRIPDTFVLTTRAYDEFLHYNGLEDILTHHQADSPGQPEPQAARRAILEGRFPPRLEDQLDMILQTMRARHGLAATLAVRSSAEEEDGLFSFAGQFETLLNVPLRKKEVLSACKKVYASLFARNALAYQEWLGYAPGGLKMAIGCVLQVDPVASGVAYTANPVNGDTEDIIINAAWGLGTSIVDGATDADHYVVRRAPSLHIAETRVGGKETMAVLDSGHGGGVLGIATPEEKRSLPSLPSETALELAGNAVDIERYFKAPQDIEWAMAADGSVFFLQARPLKVARLEDAGGPASTDETPDEARQALVFKKAGIVVQKGVAAGKAYILHKAAELNTFPKGAILVARSDSPQFIRIMPFAAAIITDTGSFTSHMASVCREFGIPTVVNTGNATQVIQHGGEITLDANESGKVMVVHGLSRAIINSQQHTRKMEELYEYRRRKYILHYISPLNLINPLADEFKAEKCRSLHDILRFVHEKSVQELINISNRGLGRPALLRLELTVPAGIHVLDIGGGVVAPARKPVTVDEIASLPFRALLEGMTCAGAWHTHAVPLGVKDFFGSVARVSVLASGASGFAENNIAVISKEYLNLNLRLGYHFTLIDSYCSDRPANNHVYFRFAGGATDIVKRSRRIQLIDMILAEFGFISKTKGDLIVARLSHLEQAEILKTLTMLGRLIAYTRQMDAVLQDMNQATLYAQKFLEGNHEL